MTDDATKRLEWRRTLRRFKYGVRVRVRLGVIEKICDKVGQTRKGSANWTQPDWSDDPWVTLLYNCIVNQEYPEQLLRGFVESAEVRWSELKHPPKVERVLDAVDKVISNQRVKLHKKFGIATKERR
jgi:hypothetical protein